jgi:hypothetical protein
MRSVRAPIRECLIAAGVLVALVLSGCQGPSGKPEPVRHKPVFYPEPPEKPRLQFVHSIAREEDLPGKAKELGAFERFVLGSEDKKTGRIEKPYGLAVYDGKIYVCDVGRRMVHVIDFRQGTFGLLTKDRRLRNPANIFIEPSGTKGPHGSDYPPLLAYRYETADYTRESESAYELCYQCHSRNSILNNESFSKHSEHLQETPCSVCHDAHGISSAQGTAEANSHLINFDISVVRPDPATGRLEFQDQGVFHGQCFLECHDKQHSPLSY